MSFQEMRHILAEIEELEQTYKKERQRQVIHYGYADTLTKERLDKLTRMLAILKEGSPDRL